MRAVLVCWIVAGAGCSLLAPSDEEAMAGLGADVEPKPEGGTTAEGGTGESRLVFGNTILDAVPNCVVANRVHDMAADLVFTGVPLKASRDTNRLGFCVDPKKPGKTLRTGTTTIHAFIAGPSGSTCAITTTLFLNGTVALGKGSITIPSGVSVIERSWAFPTTETKLAEGDRLSVLVEWQAVKACGESMLHYAGAGAASAIVLPPID